MKLMPKPKFLIYKIHIVTILVFILIGSFLLSPFLYTSAEQQYYLRVHYQEAFVNGVRLDPNNPQIVVGPGQPLSGYLKVRIENVQPGSWTTPVIGTASWTRGQFRCISGWVSSGSSIQQYNFELSAPTQPGTYYVGVFTGWMHSCDEVASNDHPRNFGDGDDVWDMPQRGWEEVMMNGQASTGPYKMPGRAIKIIVQQQTQLPRPRVSVDVFPSQIHLGEYLTITIRGRNEGGLSEEGHLAIQFPSGNPTDIFIVSSDAPSNNRRIVRTGDRIYCGNYGQSSPDCTIQARYPGVWIWETPWGSNVQRYLTVKVKPVQTGEFIFYVKLTMKVQGQNTWVSDPAPGSTSHRDQQNEYVYRYTVNVIQPERRPDEIRIINVNYPSEVRVNQRFTLTTAVQYSFSSSTQVMIQVYEHARPLLSQITDELSGSGTKSYQFDIIAPSNPRDMWQLNIHVFYLKNREWIQADIKSISIKVQESLTVGIVGFTAPTSAFVNDRITVRVNVRYEFGSATSFVGISIGLRNINDSWTRVAYNPDYQTPRTGSGNLYYDLSFNVPSTPGRYTYRIRAGYWSGTDWIITDEKYFNIEVRGQQSDTTPPTIRVITPNGGETLTVGQTFRIRWEASDNMGVQRIHIFLFQDSSQVLVIARDLQNTGYYDWTIPDRTGTNYRVRITAVDAAGNAGYDDSDAPFSILRAAVGDSFEPDNIIAQAKDIRSGEKQQRSIDPIGDIDWAKFTLSHGSRVILETSGPGTKVYDTVIELYDSQGRQVAFNDDYGGTYWSRIEIYLDSGTYYIKVYEHGNNAKIPEYFLSLTAMTGNCPIGSTVMTFNYFGVVSLDKRLDGSEQHWFEFSIPARVGLYIDILASGEGDIAVELYGTKEGKLSKIAENDRRWGDANNVGIFRTLDAGTYCIKVFEKKNKPVNYFMKINADTLIKEESFEVKKDRYLVQSLYREDLTDNPTLIKGNKIIFLKSVTSIRYSDGRVVGYEEEEITGPVKLKEWNHFIALKRRNGPNYYPGTTFLFTQSFYFMNLKPGWIGLYDETLKELLQIYKNYQIAEKALRSSSILLNLIPIAGQYLSIVIPILVSMVDAMRILGVSAEDQVKLLANIIDINNWVYTYSWMPFPTVAGFPDVRVAVVQHEFKLEFLQKDIESNEIVIITIPLLDISGEGDKNYFIFIKEKFYFE